MQSCTDLSGTDGDDTKYAETTKDVINLSTMNVAAILHCC